MTTAVRFARFNVVGALGIGVQLLIVALLVHGLAIDAVIATAAGISGAIVHNFAWHVLWTWRDRMTTGISPVQAFFRFVGANGAVSLVGSVLLMPGLLAAGLSAIAANLVTIVACGLLNFWLAHAVFRARTRHT
jgi:putative flippase GtrA